MANEWYVRRGETVYGPFTPSRLRDLATSAKIVRDDQVRAGKEGQWTAASNVNGLFIDELPSVQFQPSAYKSE